MPAIFWTGKLSWPMQLMVNANSVLAWCIGNGRDAAAMKRRVGHGYEGAFSNHVSRYDELGGAFQLKAATAQLEGVNLQGKRLLDVGCGTGVVSFLALQRGAVQAVCGDLSNYMLQMGRTNAGKTGYGRDRIEFLQLDAEVLPLEDASFDVVITGMTLGLLPNPERAVTEMARVLRPGGLLSIGAHGPEHYWEACDACFRAITKRYVLGYRLEFWPRNEQVVRRLPMDAGLVDIQIRRLTWRNAFDTGRAAYDFFSAISSNWWYAKVPPDKRDEEARKTRAYFDRRGVTSITDDIILACGCKAA